MTTLCQPKHIVRGKSGDPLQGWAVFFSFSPLCIVYLPPALSASFYRLNLHQPWPLGLHRSAWEKNGWKVTLYLGLKEMSWVKGERRSDLGKATVSVCKMFLVWACGAGLGHIRGVLSRRLLWWVHKTGHYKQRKCKEMLFSCMDSIMQESPKRTLSLSSFVGLSYATKAFPPPQHFDVALQIRSVASELHHACLVSTQFAHRSWFLRHVQDWGRDGRILSLSSHCTARSLDDVNVL